MQPKNPCNAYRNPERPILLRCALALTFVFSSACGDDSPSEGGAPNFNSNGMGTVVSGTAGDGAGVSPTGGANGDGVATSGAPGMVATTGGNVNGTTGLGANGNTGTATGTTGGAGDPTTGINASSGAGMGGITGATGTTGGAVNGSPNTLNTDCCTDADCVCRGDTPTPASASQAGPFQTDKYTSGFRDGPSFAAATIYHPTDASPPLSGIVLCPGWVSLQDSIAEWGPFLASHGIVTMIIDTNTPLDWVDVRDDALMDALASLKAEHTRSGSPLEGKLSDSRFGVGGWSMGGGGTWLATKAHPELKTGMSWAGHHATAGGPAIAQGITVPSILFAGALDDAILGGAQQSQQAYDAIPATTPKILYEFGSAGHFKFGTPTTTAGGALGRYGLAFQKVFLEGDERYRFLLLEPGPDASDWKSNIQ